MALTLAHIQIGWISALPIEALLAEIMLDELLEQTISLPPNDNSIYTYGRIKINGSDASHIVAIAQLPLSTTGKASAATVANNMRRTFQNLKFGIMVGIAGGVWTAKEDLRLGDIVVGVPDDGGPGIIQYDLGKSIQDGEFVTKGIMNKAPDLLRSAAGVLQRKHMRKPGDYVSSLEIAEVKRHASRPSVDNLFMKTYTHRSGESCEDCDKAHLLTRPQRFDLSPKVHYGAIASGDQVVKDAVFAEKIHTKHKIMCFEMEAAGLDAFPCLVVRGISDYADTHKNDDWHAYAAATAAAYAKELLAVVPLTAVADLPSTGNTHWNVPRAPNPLFTGRQSLLEDMKHNLVTRPQKNDRSVFVLQGIGGAGKSEAAIKFAEDNQHSFWGIFWIDADNRQSIEEGFVEIAKMQTPPLKDKTPKDVLRWLANLKESWLLILDNCDDADIDFSGYMPFRGGSVIITTRLTECKHLGAWKNLDDLGSDAATQLLLRACGYESSNRKAHIPDAEAVVSSLGQHALALVHAGAYIGKGLCTLDEYVHFFRKEQARMMHFKPNQQASRYGNVYATFEVSVEALASSEDNECGLALRLLNILAFLNREAVEENVFSRAFDECYKLEKEWEQNGMRCSKCPAVSSTEHDPVSKEQSELDTLDSLGDDIHTAYVWNGRYHEIYESRTQGPFRPRISDSREPLNKDPTCVTDISDDSDSELSGSYDCESKADWDDETRNRIDHLDILHCEKVRSSGLVEHQTTTRLRIARARLADLSLIKINDDKISMHPLVHEWARTRLDETARQYAWEQTMSLLALSAVDLFWHSFTPRLLPHIDICFRSRRQAESQSQLSLTVIQALYRLAWQFYATEKFQQALSIYEALSVSYEVQRDTWSPDVVLVLIDISKCLSVLRRHEEARNLAVYIVQSTEKRYGTISHIAFMSRMRLANAYTWTGEHQAAATLYELLYERYSYVLPDSQLRDLLWNLSSAHGELQNHKQAMKFAEKHLQSTEAEPLNSHGRLQALQILCAKYIDVGEAQKAVTLLEHVIDLYYEASPSAILWVEIMRTLSRAYVEVEQPDEAMSCLTEARSHCAKLLAGDTSSQRIACVMGEIAETYIDLGEFSLSATVLEEQVRLQALFYSLDHWLRLSCLGDLARLCIRLGDSEKLKKAVELLEEVIDNGQRTIHANVEGLKYTEVLLAKAQKELARVTRTQQSVFGVGDQQSVLPNRASNPPVSTPRQSSRAEAAETRQRRSGRRKKKHKAVPGNRTKLGSPIVSSTPKSKNAKPPTAEATGIAEYLRKLKLMFQDRPRQPPQARTVRQSQSRR